MLDDVLQLFDLPLAEIGRDVGRLAALHQAADDLCPRRFGQAADLVERIVADDLSGKNHTDEHRLLARHAFAALGFVHWLDSPPGMKSSCNCAFQEGCPASV